VDIKARVRVAICSGVYCAVVGSILGGTVVFVLRGIRSSEDHGISVSFIPVAVLYAAIPAVPFGLIVGAVGGWWLAPRVAGDTASPHVFLQSSVIGAILGSTFPIVAMALGWGPLPNLASFLPISIGIGTVCGLTLTAVMRKFVSTTSKEPSLIPLRPIERVQLLIRTQIRDQPITGFLHSFRVRRETRYPFLLWLHCLRWIRYGRKRRD
jgi:hypothetical protein